MLCQDWSFVTIKIFARTERKRQELATALGFVTIKIFARTELGNLHLMDVYHFVTI